MHHAIQPKTADWSSTDELLALVAELIDHQNRLFIMANTKKGAKIPKPIDIQRPTDDPAPKKERDESGVRRQATSDDIRRFFSRESGALHYFHPIPEGGDA